MFRKRTGGGVGNTLCGYNFRNDKIYRPLDTKQYEQERKGPLEVWEIDENGYVPRPQLFAREKPRRQKKALQCQKISREAMKRKKVPALQQQPKLKKSRKESDMLESGDDDDYYDDDDDFYDDEDDYSESEESDEYEEEDKKETNLKEAEKKKKIRKLKKNKKDLFDCDQPQT